MKSLLRLATLAMIPALAISQLPSSMNIEGFVRRSDTAVAIEGATIRVAITPGGAVHTATTDRDGHFVVSNLIAGNYSVSASKDGYFSFVKSIRFPAGQYLTSVGLGAPLALTPQSKPVELTLIPGGALGGHIRDSSGAPVVRAMPQLWEVVDGQSPRRVINQFPQTDDAGTYRFFGIKPGKYYLSVRVRFPVTDDVYYPGTRDLALATQLEIKSGSDSTVDLQLPPAGRSVLSGRVVPPPGLAPLKERLLVSLIARNVSGVPNAIAPTSANFARDVATDFEIRDVAAGRYDIYAYSPNAGALFGPTRVDVQDRDISEIKLPFHPTTEIRGKVVGENGSVPNLTGDLRLAPVELPAPPLMLFATMLNDDGSFVFPFVPLGEYHFNVGIGPRYSIEIKTPAQPSGKDTLVVDGPDASPVVVTLKLAPR
jgi:hypothetical protein